MKRRFFYQKVIFFIYFPFIALSQGNLGSNYNGLTGLSSHNSINYHNPAVIANKNIININISPGLFNMSELQNNEINSKLILYDNFYANLGYCGINNNLYNDNSITGGLAYKFSPIFQIGINLKYNIYTVKDFSTINSLSINMGGIVKLDENLIAAFVLDNLNRESRISDDENPEQIAAFGLAYKLNDNFVIEGSSIINIAKSNSFVVSTRYDIEEILSLRIGFLTEPQTFTLGVNYNMLDDLFINYDISKNNILGYTHRLGLSYIW